MHDHILCYEFDSCQCSASVLDSVHVLSKNLRDMTIKKTILGCLLQYQPIVKVVVSQCVFETLCRLLVNVPPSPVVIKFIRERVLKYCPGNRCRVQSVTFFYSEHLLRFA